MTPAALGSPCAQGLSDTDVSPDSAPSSSSFADACEDPRLRAPSRYDVHETLEVTLEELYSGAQRLICVDVVGICSLCLGVCQGAGG